MRTTTLSRALTGPSGYELIDRTSGASLVGQTHPVASGRRGPIRGFGACGRHGLAQMT